MGISRRLRDEWESRLSENSPSHTAHGEALTESSTTSMTKNLASSSFAWTTAQTYIEGGRKWKDNTARPTATCPWTLRARTARIRPVLYSALTGPGMPAPRMVLVFERTLRRRADLARAVATRGGAEPHGTDLVSSTSGAGHFMPMVPFIRAFLRAGHDVMVAGPASLAESAVGTGAVFWPFDDPPADEMAAVSVRLPLLSNEEANAVVCGEIFARLNSTAAVPRLREAIVVPLFAGDQYINADRVAEVGAGVRAAPEAAAIRSALAAVLSSSAYRTAAQGLASELAAQPPVDRAVDMIGTNALLRAAGVSLLIARRTRRNND